MTNASRFRTILVPVDGSPLAEQALPLAQRTAEAAGSKLRLALVHQLSTAPLDPAAGKTFAAVEIAARKAERAYLRLLQAKLREAGIRLSSAVTLSGPVGPALAQYVRELGIDLVVMGTHGRGGFRRTWLGSVADYLVRRLEVPVLLVRQREAERAAPAAKPDQILVALDGSPLAEEALGPAAELARLWQAELTLLQVVHPVVLYTDDMLGIAGPYDQGLTAELRAQAEDYVRDIAERLRADGFRATGTAVVGWGAADAILEAARPERTAAIAIATHGRGGIQRLALGSVADKLIRAAEVPVLVHRPAHRVARTTRRKRSSAAGASGRSGR